jgi:hypothetical protein
MMTCEYPFDHSRSRHVVLLPDAVENEEFRNSINVEHNRVHPNLSELLLNCLEVDHKKRWSIVQFKDRYDKLSKKERQIHGL